MILVEIKATDRVGYLHRVGTIEIINDLTGTVEKGNYKITWFDDEQAVKWDSIVLEHDRSEHILSLIHKATGTLQDGKPDLSGRKPTVRRNLSAKVRGD